VCNPRQRDPFQNLGRGGTVESGGREFEGGGGWLRYEFVIERFASVRATYLWLKGALVGDRNP
jgi:hypothetical protein